MTVSAAVVSSSPIQIAGLPVTVPTDYLGLSARGWPLYNAAWINGAESGQPVPTAPSPSPSFLPYVWTRTWDSGYCLWADIETAPGVYNWTNVDLWITAQRQAGKSVQWVFCITPTFYADQVTVLGNGFTAAATAYGAKNTYFGGGGPPSIAANNSAGVNGLTAVSNFITVLITRYNSASGAWRVANPTLGKGIGAIESWQECTFNGVSEQWWGSAAQMVDLCYTVKTAARAVDSSIQWSGPSWNTATSAQTFLAASGAVNTGVTAGSLYYPDGNTTFNYHPYNINLPGIQFGSTWYDLLTHPVIGINNFRAIMAGATGGSIASVPIQCNECGFDYNFSSTPLTAMQNQPPQYRYTYWMRAMMVMAAYGVKRWGTYAWDCPFSCYPVNDPNGMQQALIDFAAHVVGKTIASATYVVGGAVTLTFSDSSVYSV